MNKWSKIINKHHSSSSETIDNALYDIADIFGLGNLASELNAWVKGASNNKKLSSADVAAKIDELFGPYRNKIGSRYDDLVNAGQELASKMYAVSGHNRSKYIQKRAEIAEEMRQTKNDLADVENAINNGKNAAYAIDSMRPGERKTRAYDMQDQIIQSIENKIKEK